MVRNLLLFFSFMLIAGSAIGQTSLEGKVTDEGTGDPMIVANVAIFKNGNMITGVNTDFDGNYSFTNIDPGTYDLEVSYIGYAAAKITGIKVLAGAGTKVDVKLREEGEVLDEIVVTAYKVPLMKADETTQGQTLTSEEIKNLPSRSINGIASNAAGAASTDEGEDLAIRGSRTSSTVYMVDGMRVQGSLIPESEIDQLQVITGGIEAKYGDVTGGVISITTKGPSSKFSGGIDAETSKFLDPFDSNILGFNLSGPIVKNKNDKTKTILGFRLAGRYTYRGDDDPNAIPVYRIKDAKLAEIEANPVIEVGGDPLVAADFLTNDDVDVLKAQPFESSTGYTGVAKLDARLSEAIDISLSGSYVTSSNQFTPNESSRTRANWRVLNSHNNPFSNSTDYRANFRFRHRLGGGVVSSEDGKEEGSSSVIRNVSYTLQGGIEKNLNDLTDPRHKFNYFDYGYIGKLDYEWVPSIQASFDTTGTIQFQHVDYRQVLRGYNKGDANPVLANYNNYLGVAEGDQLNGVIGDYVFSGQNNGDLITGTDFVTYNGTVSQVFQDSWGFHTNVGTVYNRARKDDDDIYSFNATANFDIVAGSSDKGRHSIELGVNYEQRTNRRYEVFPRNLWTIARQKANDHIQGIPFDEEGNPLTAEVGTVTVTDPITGLDVEVPLFGLDFTENVDNTFYKKVREANGVNLDQFINIDGLSPDQMSLDMFSAKELNDEGLLNYYGYDYLGNKFDGTFDDFFTARDGDDIRTFPIAPSRPIYTAAYLQDKFKYKDIIFRVGVRLDRYDANTKVLKDKYSLYEIMGADEFHASGIGTKPGNIGADYKVYLESPEASSGVKAYRDGDQWYRANGAPVNSPSEIFSGGLVTPKYKDSRAAEDANFIKSPDFDPSVSFKDYEVQVNVMPRLAFSFPIGEDENGETSANFFAHYDILVERPPSNTIATAKDYFYFIDEANQTKNNPDLKPARTVDYEVGFQQRLNNTSAIKISAYYKELRDMIQLRTIFPVPDITSYETYDNLDFGTIKGFSFSYDMRRTKNLMINANYTLQFADGTGSSANSSSGISSRGVIRNLSPLSLDERHRFVLSLDYRYPEKNYTGPELFGVPIFANMGFNLLAKGISGRPYTANITPLVLDGSQISGAINGARKPFTYSLDFRVDKTIHIGANNSFNIYLRISNLLDTRNVIDVYPATGSPEDDGFLASARGADALAAVRSSKLTEAAYLASYQWRRLNPNFYSLPRRIFVGASFSF